MKTVVLYMSSCLSCFIVMTILLEFMNERYKRSFKNKYLYLAVKLGLTAAIAGVNMMNSAILNFLFWVAAVAGCAYCLYYEDADKPVKRILECEILICIIAVCETLGVVITDGILEILGVEIASDLMINSLKVAFSKVILIFLYYIAVVRLMRKREIPVSHLQYFFNFAILAYTLIDIVLADLYLVYLVKVMNEKGHLEYEMVNCLFYDRE